MEDDESKAESTSTKTVGDIMKNNGVRIRYG